MHVQANKIARVGVQWVRTAFVPLQYLEKCKVQVDNCTLYFLKLNQNNIKQRKAAKFEKVDAGNIVNIVFAVTFSVDLIIY